MHDFCIIGGGIVGLSVAYNLMKRFPGCDLVLLEKEDQLGRHQTGHNSGVIHSGIYYQPGSLKADLCKRGAEMIKAFCKEHKIAFETCGKFLVATDAREKALMDKLAERAVDNKVEFDPVDAAELARLEPSISGVGALFVPSTGIVDYKEVCRVLAALIKDSGGAIETGKRVTAIVEDGTGVTVSTKDCAFSARQLVVCAGVQADRMVRLSGLRPGFRIVPFRGEYYQLPDHRSDLISALIYPIPDPELPFLGIHLTRMIDGSITVGPNAVLGMAREKYPRFSFSLPDVVDYLQYPGFWRVIGKNIGPAITEIRNSAFKSGYLAACRKYCPSLTKEDLLPYEAGIRAQAVMADGSFAQDFLFQETGRMIHVCNAPSPAATSSLPIGAMIADKVASQRKRP